MSPSAAKQKGDRAERAFVAYARPLIPTLRRTKAGGEKDLGDTSGFVDVDGDEWCVQIADRKWRNHGEVEAKAEEARRQAMELGAPRWCLVAKRPRSADVGGWFVWTPLWHVLDFAGACNWRMEPNYESADDLACITVRAWLALVAPWPAGSTATGDGTT